MVARQLGREPMQLTAFSCPIVPSLMQPNCRILADKLKAEAQSAGIRVIVLANSWQDAELTPAALAELEAWWGSSFDRVIVLGPLPLFEALEERLLRWTAGKLSALSPSLDKQKAFLDALPSAGGASPAIRFVDVVAAFCNDRPSCSVLAGQPLMLDHDGHLTRYGADLLGQMLNEVVDVATVAL